MNIRHIVIVFIMAHAGLVYAGLPLGTHLLQRLEGQVIQPFIKSLIEKSQVNVATTLQTIIEKNVSVRSKKLLVDSCIQLLQRPGAAPLLPFDKQLVDEVQKLFRAWSSDIELKAVLDDLKNNKKLSPPLRTLLEQFARAIWEQKG